MQATERIRPVVVGVTKDGAACARQGQVPGCVPGRWSPGYGGGVWLSGLLMTVFFSSGRLWR